MLPRVKNEEFVRLANEFRKEFLNSNENEFVEYLSEQYPQLQVNPNKNSIKTRDAKNGFRYVLQQEANNVSESEWIVQNKHVYERTMESTNSSLKSLKRTIENGNLRESVAPMKKRKQDSSIIDKVYNIYSDEFIRDQLNNIAEFPESLIEDANRYFSIPNKKECTRIVFIGSQKCGKTTFVFHLSQKYGYQYVEVALNKISHIRLNKSFVENFKEYEKVLLHFPLNEYNYKVAENSDFLSSKFVLIFEIDDHKSLNLDSDYNLIFPCAKEEDRLKYLNHFIEGIKLEDPLTVDTMKKYTPGYEIGHIKNLCKLLKAYKNVTEEIFFDIVKSGKIKESFLDRPNGLREDIGGRAQDSGSNNPSLKLSITPVDDKILFNYRFNEQLMAQVESLMKDTALTYITIGGRPCSGKTTLIKYISEIYRYGLVSFSPNYFRERNFNLEQLQNDLNHLLEENGRLMVHIVKENVPRDVLNQILLKFESNWLSRDILFVFEKTTTSAADVVIPRLSDEEILRLLRMSVFIDVDLSQLVCHTKEWTHQQFVALRTFRDSISTENDLLSKIDLLNRILKTLI